MARASKASTAKKSAKKSSKKKPAPKKSRTKKSATKKSTVKRSTTASPKKAAPKKAAKKSPTKRSAAKKSSTKKAAAKKSTAKKASASRAGGQSSTKAKKTMAKSPFDKKFLDRMRKLLQVERDTYERQAGQLRAEAASLVDSMEPGDVNFDEEGGEGDTIAVERNRDLALASKATEMIEEIDHALGKFDTGTYGICEVSGDPIPEERLEAIPWARERVEYKVGGFGRR